MAINLINILQKSFTEESYQDITEHVGVNLESTKNGLKAIVPVILASILGNNTVNSSSQPVWWKSLDKDYPYSEDDFVDTKNISTPSFLVSGREIISGMFRTNHDELIGSVSSVSGIQKEKSAGLIEVGVPLIVGHLKNWVLKKGWKFKDLVANLIENKTLITNALPSGISLSHFGLANIEKNNFSETIKGENPKNNFSETIKTEIPTEAKPTKKKKFNGIFWFGGILILAIILWYFMGSKSCIRSLNTDDLLVPDMTEAVI